MLKSNIYFVILLLKYLAGNINFLVRKPLKYVVNNLIKIVMIFLLLFQGQLFFVMFKSFEKKYKYEVKKLIKEGVDEKDLIKFTFPLNEEGNVVADDFLWIKENEFRYKGEMYDVVRFEINNKSAAFHCIHDFKESRLFANLDEYLSDYLNKNPEKKNQAVKILDSISLLYTISNSYEIVNYPSDYRKLEIQYNPSILYGYYPTIIHPPQFS